jgi:hypothetical protein
MYAPLLEGVEVEAAHEERGQRRVGRGGEGGQWRSATHANRCGLLPLPSRHRPPCVNPSDASPLIPTPPPLRQPLGQHIPRPHPIPSPAAGHSLDLPVGSACAAGGSSGRVGRGLGGWDQGRSGRRGCRGVSKHGRPRPGNGCRRPHPKAPGGDVGGRRQPHPPKAVVWSRGSSTVNPFFEFSMRIHSKGFLAMGLPLRLGTVGRRNVEGVCVLCVCVGGGGSAAWGARAALNGADTRVGRGHPGRTTPLQHVPARPGSTLPRRAPVRSTV